MSISATGKIYIKFSGDQESELIYNSGPLSNSPNISELVSLSIGDNEITVPEIDDFTVHGVVIVPPSANVVQLVLKGSETDIGLSISGVNPTLLQFGETMPESLFVSVTSAVVGLRLIWF